jgi:glycosyltransferase involved in cell wall biosynthesis
MIERRLRHHSYDLLIAAETTPEIAYVRTEIPLILITDATFAQRHNYEPAWSHMFSWSAQQADAIESRAYNNAHALLLNSQWAARSMVQDYYIDPRRLYSVPFGAPLLSIPLKEIALTKRCSYHCTLLFIGDNWQHKGGNIAFQTLLSLEQNYAIKAELIVCGTTPPLSVQHPRIKIFPTLDRSNEVQRNELERLYLRADFLLVPTRSETTGIYCCEASAYGVPSLVADTGPLTEIISNGKNGFVLPVDAQATAYSRIIAELYHNEQRYQALVRNSRRHFEEHLNWDAWGKAVQTILQEIMTASPT